MKFDIQLSDEELQALKDLSPEGLKVPMADPRLAIYNRLAIKGLVTIYKSGPLWRHFTRSAFTLYYLKEL